MRHFGVEAVLFMILILAGVLIELSSYFNMLSSFYFRKVVITNFQDVTSYCFSD